MEDSNPCRARPRHALAAALLIGGLFGGAAGAGAQTLTVLHSFAGGDGSYPYAGLMIDPSGNLFGTTSAGGAGRGTVFKLAPNSDGTYSESLVLKFAVGGGAAPYAGLIADGLGNLYGTTADGGVFDEGTVFKLMPNGDGTYSAMMLQTFSFPSGEFPYAGLIADASGNLYGTATQGGAGFGTVFRLSPNGDGTYATTVLHRFTGTDGASPYAGLLADASGSLYGTTFGGGTDGFGTVFKLTSAGDGTYSESVLYSFDFATGANPYGGLVADAAGNLYGTTFSGGTGHGTVFKLTRNTDGTYTESVLHSFTGNDGAFPYLGGLIADASGNLYGMTYGGGTSNLGVVFKVTPTGTETVLHSFTGADGAIPSGRLVADASGNLYGTTSSGGASNLGTVFELAAVVAPGFNGMPGEASCFGQSIASLAKKYHGIDHAAASLGYDSVKEMINAVAAYCGG